ncbi:MAG: TonB family protein [Oleiphilaceae bacterium]|nr:TonB family protein [Oleiphilaceae bacterium]
MTLALAVASGLHGLLLLAVAPPQEHEPRPDRTVQVRLGAPQHPSSQSGPVPATSATAPSPAIAGDSPMNDPPRGSGKASFSADDTVAATGPSPQPADQHRDAGPDSGESRTARSDPAPVDNTRDTPPPGDSPSKPDDSNRADTLAGTISPPRQSDPQTEQPLRQESRDRVRPPLPPYELEIRRSIARALRYNGAMAELDSPRRLMLEIELMDNGIVKRASVTESSGDERIDRQARQAALVASPLPSVPAHYSKRRFEVELRFNPSALTARSDRS